MDKYESALKWCDDLDITDVIESMSSRLTDGGGKFMAKMLDECVSFGYTTVAHVKQLIQLAIEVRHTHIEYSTKFQYYWSVHTYLVSVLEEAERRYGVR